MADYSYRELQKCAEREAAMRANVYKRNGMTPARNEELQKMKAIAELLKDLADGEPKVRHG